MSDFMHRLFTSSDKAGDTEAGNEPASDTPSPSAVPTGVAAHSAGRLRRTEPSKEGEQHASQVDATGSSTVGHREPEVADEASIEVGGEVAAILASAKQATQRLRDTARGEAERIRAEAKQEAGARLEQIDREVERRRLEATNLRTDAEAYAKSTREAADRHAGELRRTTELEAEQRRSDATQEAIEIRRAGRERADELREQALQHRKALIAEAGRSEARLQKLLDVFQAMTTQLENLLEEARAEPQDEEQAAAPRGGLAEALEAQAAVRPPTTP